MSPAPGHRGASLSRGAKREGAGKGTPTSQREKVAGCLPVPGPALSGSLWHTPRPLCWERTSH